ncbi:hypothetical protein ACFQZ4_21895 [Catellatospora coxensis]
METAHDVLIALTRRYAFAEVAALVAPDSGVLPRAAAARCPPSPSPTCSSCARSGSGCSTSTPRTSAS